MYKAHDNNASSLTGACFCVRSPCKASFGNGQWNFELIKTSYSITVEGFAAGERDIDRMASHYSLCMRYVGVDEKKNLHEKFSFAVCGVGLRVYVLSFMHTRHTHV